MKSRKLKYNKTSRFRGVSWSVLKLQWQVVVSLPGTKLKHLGHYHDEMDAVLAYDKFVRNNDMAYKANFPTYRKIKAFRSEYENEIRHRMISSQRIRLQSLKRAEVN